MTNRVTRGRALLTELLSVRPPEYFILVFDDAIEFVRVSGRGGMDSLYRETITREDSQDWETFCHNLSKHPAYFGQPVRVLIGNRRAWTYFKRLEGTSPAKLLEKLQAVPTSHMELNQKTALIQKQRVFVLQAIEKDYLRSIELAARNCGIQVLDVATLAAQLLTGCPSPSPGRAASSVFRFNGSQSWYSVSANNGGILVDRLPTALSDLAETEVFDHLEWTYQTKDAVRTVFNGVPKKTQTGLYQTSLLGRVLRSSLKRQQLLRTIVYKTASSRPALGLRVGLNSTRLLAILLIMLTLLLGIVTGFTSVWSSKIEQPLEDFQHRYSTKLQLLSRLEQLKAEESRLRSAQGPPRQTAALASAFCQRAFGGLFLTELAVRYSTEDSVVVEAKGAAKRESTVFALRDHLAEQLQPLPVTVNSVRPRQRTSSQGTDSLFTFGLTVTLHE